MLNTVATARIALSQELMIAASSAPTKMAMAIGCRCSSASTGMTDSELSRPGIVTLAMMPRNTGMSPNPRYPTVAR